MQEHKTFPGKIYVVTCKVGCDITDASGELEETCEPGKQKAISAPSDKLYTSQPATVRETFKVAPIGLFGTSGGTVASPLPEDYLEADFIQFDGTDYVSLPDKTVAGDRIVFSTITKFTGHLNETQREGKYSSPLFYYGLDGGTFRYGLNANTVNTQVPADTDWHKVTLSYTPSFSSFRLDGAEFSATYNPDSVVLPWGMCIGITLNSMYYCYSRKKRTTLQINGVLKKDLIPGITKAGNVVFYDKVSGSNLAGQNKKLRAGLTIVQARQLGKLPDGGGTIKVCLPENYREDEFVNAAMAEAESKGWIFDIDWYEAGAAASTFALRRVLVRKTPDEYGNYVDAQGVRYFVETTQEIIGADPESLGYEAFRSVESAVAYWELEPIVNAEEEFLTEE